MKRAAGDWIAAACAVLLIVALVELKWYGYAGAQEPIAPGPVPGGAVAGWHALTSLRWLAVAACAYTVLVLVARITLGDRFPAPAIALVTMLLGAVTTVMLLYRVVFSLPGAGAFADQKLGAMLGVICAAGIAYGGYESRHRA